jgi:DNA-binding transcriptional ArsR family regulator
MKHELPMSDRMMELVAKRFRLLGEPMRLRMLQALERGELTVNEIVERSGATQSNVSKHLAVLYEGGLVGRRREGTSVVYFIADPVIFKLCELVCHGAKRSAQAEMAALGITNGR